MNILIISDEDKKGKKLRYKEWSKITQKEISKIFKDEKEDNQSKLTEEQENNIKFLKELWIDFYESNESHKEKAKNTKLNNEQIENIKTIIYDLWINIKIDFIDKIKDIKLNEEEIKNIKIIKNELWFYIWGDDINKIKDIKLDEEQIKIIKTIKNELWFSISINDIDAIKDIKLDEEQIENIKIIKNEFWIYVNKKNIDIIKDIKLNEEQIENIKIIKNELWFSISIDDIDAIKDIKIDEEQIENIKIIKNELWFHSIELIKEFKKIETLIKGMNMIKLNETNYNFLNKGIEEIIQKIRALWINMEEHHKTNLEYLKLDEEQIKNIKIIKNELWIYMNEKNIDIIKDIKLDEEQIENIKIIKNELWISISIDDIDAIKDIKLNEEQIKNIKIIKNEFWIYVNGKDVDIIKSIKLDEEQIKKIKNLQYKILFKISSFKYFKKINETDFDINKLEQLKKLWIDIKENNIIELNETTFDIKELEQLKKLWININILLQIKDIKEHDFDINKLEQLKKLWIDIKENNIIELNEVNYDFNKLNEIKEKLKNYWINIDRHNVIELNKTDIDFNKLQQLKNLWININKQNFIKLNKTIFDFKKLKEIKEKIQELWIKMDENNIIELNNIKLEDFKRIKEIYKEYWFIICTNKNEWDKLNLSEEERRILKKADNTFKKNWIIITSTEEIKVILDIIWNTFQNKRNYLDKKNKFLKENQTLSDERFDELFKNWIDKWKYWIQNIHQTDLWYCYAYTWFELLKKSNFFETLIKTSMKEKSTWWEIKIPLWDTNWHIIKVNKEEIDKKFSYKSIDDWKYKNNININSKSSLWFKILEIAFIKEYIINPPEYIINPPKDNEKDFLYCKRRKEFLEKTGKKSEYERTWDIEITWELLNIVEWWFVNNFMEKMIQNATHQYTTDNLNSIKSIFDFVNTWIIKIWLSYDTQGIRPKAINYILKDWSKCPIDSDHAYSIERILIDNKTWEKYIIFVNPRNTSEKHKVTLDECIKIFNSAEITTIDINKLFNNN